MKKNPFKLLTKIELRLWIISCLLIFISFIFNSHRDILTLIASITGATSLIYIAKGEAVGQILTVVFSILYAVISFKFRYYGEMITYLGMTGPIAFLSVISWIRHPYKEGAGEVQVANMNPLKFFVLCILAAVVTGLFYFIMKYFGNANLALSTVSITTSFLASGLMFLRSPFYAVAYACNDIVLIVLWIMASVRDISYLPMIMCFVIFFINDIYGFVSWKKMKVRQQNSYVAKELIN